MAVLLERRALQSWAAPAALLLFYAWIVLITAWLGDDSFISFRQVLNAIDGDGFTANYGQRVQAFTHPSWVLLLTAVVFVTREIYLTAIVLSAALSLVSVYFVIRYAALLPDGRSTPLFLYAFLIVLAFSKAFTDYMTSGLENALSFFLVGFVILQSQRRESDAETTRRSWLLFAALALAFLNRFDNAVLLVPLSLYLILAMPRARVFKAALPGAALVVTWFLFSLFYFGTPLPNTYYAKLATGFPSEEIHARGAAYFSVGLSQDPVTMALIACGVVAGLVARSWLNGSLSVGVVLYSAYIFNMGGDFMQGRFFAILAYIAVFNLVSIDERRRPLGALKSGFLLACAVAVFFGPKPPLSAATYWNVTVIDGVGDERGAWYQPYGLLSPLREWPPIGAPATGRPTEYRLTCAGSDALRQRDVFWIDVCALSDAFLARLPAVRSRDWRIGHHFRKVPTGYGDVQVGRSEELDDPELQELFDDVQRVISGALFSVERMKAIVRLNTASSYRYDRDDYTDPGVLVPLSSRVIQTEYSRVRREPPDAGALWLVVSAEGVVWPQEHVATSFDAGLAIAVEPSVAAQAISLSLDGNDAYRMTLNGGEYVVRIEPSTDIAGRRLALHRVELPEPRRIASIEIEPIEGDGYYALGHLLIEGSR